MLEASRVKNEEEFDQILRLQQLFLRGKTNPEDEKEQGFLTVAHNKELLLQMHSIEPSIIVKDMQQLVGYALVMPKACRTMIPVLMPMFEVFDNLSYGGRPLNEFDFYVMGQICVEKSYRGKGVFDLLYQYHKKSLSPRYDFVITEIATRNTRSLKAHERIGFEPFHIYRDQTDEWAVVIWDWKK